MDPIPLIEKLYLLESKLEVHNLSIFEPISFNSWDILEVQEVGKNIAQHIGLPQLTFIITYVKQKSNVAGHINLNDNKDIFIEIESDIKYNQDIVLTVLAHEICHKYLHLNNIKLFPDYENEILTDIATVYTGLGKLSLNGRIKVDRYSRSKDNDTTIKTTYSPPGYLTRQQVAFIYKLVCSIRKIPDDLMMQGLNNDAICEIRNISNDSIYFNNHYFDNDFVLDEISRTINKEIEDCQIAFAELHRDIRIIQESILPLTNKLLIDFHSFTKTNMDKIQSKASEKYYNADEKNYVKNLLALQNLKFIANKLLEKSSHIEKLRYSFPKFIAFIHDKCPKQFSLKNLDFLFNFHCPTCNEKMRLRKQILARVICPNCKYSFIVATGDNEMIYSDYNEFMPNSHKIKEKNPKGFWARLKFICHL